MTTNTDIELKRQNKEELEREKEEWTDSPISEVIRVDYRGSTIRIFSKIGDYAEYFYDPLVQLDTNSIIVESNSFLQKDVVRFTIQMFNPEIRAKVLARLRSLPTYNMYYPPERLQEEDISVLPFKEVRLVQKEAGIQPSVRLMEEPKSYLLPSESLYFYLICDSSTTANAFAEDFRRNPEFVLEHLQLSMECRGVTLKTYESSRVNFKYNITTSPIEDSSGAV